MLLKLSIPYLFYFLIILLFFSCRFNVASIGHVNEALEESIKSGGETTVFDNSKRAFSFSANNLTSEEQALFQAGDNLFHREWQEGSNALFPQIDGLGPTFNAKKCSECHIRDGRGFPSKNGNLHNSLLFKISISGENPHGQPQVDSNYGDQFNHSSVNGAKNEGFVSLSIIHSNARYPDGTPFSLAMPIYTLNGNYGTTTHLLISPRIAPQMIGLGLLEAISSEDIFVLEDPDDSDKDGISGKANQVWDFVNNQKTLGRFGWKANQPQVRQQVAVAFLGDLGITSTLFPKENIPVAQKSLLTLPGGGDPEISDEQLDRVAFYSKTLAVPARRGATNTQVIKGEKIFEQINCSACHIPSFTTGSHEIAALSKQKIYPYTDLLLHDLGEALADNRPDFEASGNEWRTPPLWGIGLFEKVNHHTRYLHDGRARNLEEAILWHEGEAKKAKESFMHLGRDERSALISFLKSL